MTKNGLINSEGCIEALPMINHRLAPFLSGPNIITKNSNIKKRINPSKLSLKTPLADKKEVNIIQNIESIR